ncbi:DUF885 family protein [Altererythrobacter endophyticus]|uniref:DUF885 family protein n=2 Tax=Altericroceibacterium endophyticum TaxID=1808508 RepID=A0A6I4T215_9SPHN|nr:DUF885 family protein [Altericroceibacterium endophyticum]
MRISAFAAVLLSSAALQPAIAAPSTGDTMMMQEKTPQALADLFADWRQVAAPERKQGVPDFSAAALERQAEGLAAMRARLSALERSGWSKRDQADAQLIEAEMNGLDFDLRVARPWGRDPSYFATVFAEESDVPAHEGPSADVIDLFAYDYPLSAQDAAELEARLRTVPVLLDDARTYLADGNARDLWQYGSRAFNGQAAALDELANGPLEMRTVEGTKVATLDGAPASLKDAVIAARDASRDFSAWVKAQAPSKTGPSGLGRENYDWYMKHVQLVPYDWDEQLTLLQRELDRSLAALALEEWRNRDLPQLEALDDPAAYNAFAKAKMSEFIDFVIDSGFLPDKPYYRAALEAQTLSYIPPEKRVFFYHVTALDPWPLYSHDIHWPELARLKHDPEVSAIRQVPPLYNIYSFRSEGLATGFEELMLQAGLYEDAPRARELVWIMLANRAARGIASLHVQANEMTLKEAGIFHSKWTPRGWADPESDLVGFEQLLYLRQPGYGTSYIIGKQMLDEQIARRTHLLQLEGKEAPLPEVFKSILDEGIVPWTLMQEE